MLKKTVIIALITVFILISSGIIIECSSIRVIGRCSKYVDDYNEFYLYKMNISVEGFFGQAMGSGYKIWIKPGRKEKLLNKIKEDVNAQLMNISTNNSEIIDHFEVDNDFKKIYIYYKKDSGFIDFDNNTVVQLLEQTVAYKVELYHQILHGYGKTEYDGDIISFVEAP